jgi:antitoxin HicB
MYFRRRVVFTGGVRPSILGEGNPLHGTHSHRGGKEMTKPRKGKNPHIGGNFDSFLKREDIYGRVNTTATKRTLATQLEKAMKQQNLTKAEMACRMKSSRTQLDRLLDPDDDSVTLATLRRAAAIVGREVRLEII